MAGLSVFVFYLRLHGEKKYQFDSTELNQVFFLQCNVVLIRHLPFFFLSAVIHDS